MRWSRFTLSCVFGIAICMGSVAHAPVQSRAETYKPVNVASQTSSPRDFLQWVNSDFRASALRAGVSADVFDREAARISYIPRVIELDRKQPEHKIGFDEYQSKTFTASRVAQGRDHFDQYRSVLRDIENRYGVQAEYIVALWGMETSYGKNTGGFDILSALATLAYDGRRGAYFKDEAIKALKILQGGHIDRAEFKGSWAGAMGQVQFMPTSWQNFAVDYNSDGHKDIWTTRIDAFASAANYLRQNGWAHGRSWGRQVTVPSGFSEGLMDRKIRKSASEWSSLGVRGLEGQSGNFYLVKPRGSNGKVYAGTENLATIMKWNNSSFFAITVGQLGDAIAGRRGSVSSISTSTTSSGAGRTGNVISNRPELVQPHYND
jgi:membrane-bound lytic murein transglycosylase B